MRKRIKISPQLLLAYVAYISVIYFGISAILELDLNIYWHLIVLYLAEIILIGSASLLGLQWGRWGRITNFGTRPATTRLILITKREVKRAIQGIPNLFHASVIFIVILFPIICVFKSDIKVLISNIFG
jgi:hypothetical protein